MVAYYTADMGAVMGDGSPPPPGAGQYGPISSALALGFFRGGPMVSGAHGIRGPWDTGMRGRDPARTTGKDVLGD